jgi:hypothetical protein
MRVEFYRLRIRTEEFVGGQLQSATMAARLDIEDYKRPSAKLAPAASLHFGQDGFDELAGGGFATEITG